MQRLILSQNLCGDPVLFPSVEGFGVEHDVRTVARLRAGDVALPTQLHPRYGQDRPGQTGSGQRTTTSITRKMGDAGMRQHTPSISVGEGEDVMFIVLQT